MAGNIQQIFGMTEFNFTQTETTTTEDFIELPLVLNVDVSQWRKALLLVRVHAVALQGGNSFRFIARRCAPTEEDPAQYFWERDADMTLDVDTSNSAPDVKGLTLDTHLGGWISIFLRPIQTSPGNTLTARFSAELSLKEA